VSVGVMRDGPPAGGASACSCAATAAVERRAGALASVLFDRIREEKAEQAKKKGRRPKRGRAQ
jgi:hypothetical protein